jgi:hypothetical protein
MRKPNLLAVRTAFRDRGCIAQSDGRTNEKSPGESKARRTCPKRGLSPSADAQDTVTSCSPCKNAQSTLEPVWRSVSQPEA